MLRKLYRSIKYSFFTTPELEYINFHKKRRQSLIDDYMHTHVIKKLQIGAQSNSIDEWLNVDIHPKAHSVAYMDATETFPIPNSTFDYVFSEHMIEHITFSEAEFMLKECYRILKKEGVIRIATPNLYSVVDVLLNEHTESNQAYIKFYLDKFSRPELPRDPVFVVNTMFYEFGHRFIHTEKSLRYMLFKAGFSNITVKAVGESNVAELRNVEQHAVEIGVQNNAFETIILEAVKA